MFMVFGDCCVGELCFVVFWFVLVVVRVVYRS